MTADQSDGTTAWSRLAMPRLQTKRVPRAARLCRGPDLPRDDHRIDRKRPRHSGAAAGNGGEVGKGAPPGLAWVSEDIDELDDTFENLFKEATKTE